MKGGEAKEFFSFLKYDGYKIEAGKLTVTDSKEIDWAFIPIIIAFVLSVIVWIILYAAAREINVELTVGNRVQQECGKSYMEIETARYRLYNKYNDKIGKKLANIKNILMISLLLLIIGIFVMWLLRYLPFGLEGAVAEPSVISSTDVRTIFIAGLVGAAVAVVAFLIYYAITHKAALENRYAGSAKKNTMITAALLSIILIGLGIMLGMVFWIDSSTEKKGINTRTNIFILAIIAIVIVITSMFAVNIGTDKINDGFINPYGANVISINNSIKYLQKGDDCTSNMEGCIIQSGPDSGTTVAEWMKLTLGRNIKRMNPDERENPELILNGSDSKGNKYSNNLYGYIENEQGRELAELPDTNANIKKRKDNIRQRMWENRNNNDKMMKSVKRFMRTVYAVVFMILFVIMFILFHQFYASYPTLATHFMIIRSFMFLIIVAVLCWLMVAVVYR